MEVVPSAPIFMPVDRRSSAVCLDPLYEQIAILLCGRRKKQKKRVCGPCLSHTFVDRACTDSAKFHTEVGLEDSVDVQNLGTN